MLWILIMCVVIISILLWGIREEEEWVGILCTILFFFGVAILTFLGYVVTPEFSPENITFISEERAVVTTENEIYISLQENEYLLKKGYGFVSNNSDEYYDIKTYEEIFENGEKANLHIVKSDEYKVPIIKKYVYKNTFLYFNLLNVAQFKILVLPENWGVEAN